MTWLNSGMTLLLLMCFDWKAASRTSALSGVSGNNTDLCVQTYVSDCLTRCLSLCLSVWLTHLYAIHTDTHKLLSSQVLTYAHSVFFPAAFRLMCNLVRFPLGWHGIKMTKSLIKSLLSLIITDDVHTKSAVIPRMNADHVGVLFVLPLHHKWVFYWDKVRHLKTGFDVKTVWNLLLYEHCACKEIYFFQFHSNRPRKLYSIFTILCMNVLFSLPPASVVFFIY